MHEYMKRLKAGKACQAIDTGSLEQILIDHAPQCRVHEPGFCDCDVVIKGIQHGGQHYQLLPDGRLKKDLQHWE